MSKEDARSTRAHAVWLWLALPLISALCVLEPARRPLPQHPSETPDPAAVTLLFGGRLDPNRASSWDLQLLSGIGPARAAAIAGHATLHPYVQLSDLAHVRGIGPKTVERLSPWLEIQPAVADPDASAQSPPRTTAAGGTGVNGSASWERSEYGRTTGR